MKKEVEKVKEILEKIPSEVEKLKRINSEAKENFKKVKSKK